MRFGILGPLELVEDGRPVEISGRRQRTVLALLLVHANEVVSSDRLIEGLWGEQPPATAAKVLQNAISQLRRALGDNLIVTRAPGYALRVEPSAIDARRFETLLDEGRKAIAAGDSDEAAAILSEALALWRGPPLDEFAYEPFAEAEIARLEELRIRALEERIEADLALGRHADVISELEQLVAEHPLRERPRGQLVLALYRSGRQAEALRVYEDGRRLLAEELGLEPGVALQQLQKQILTHDRALEPPLVAPAPKEERRREAATRTLPKRPRPRRALALAAITLTAAALLATVLLTRGGDTAPTVVSDSLVKIDPETGEIVGVFRIGAGPSKPAIVGNYVFVLSEERQILARIDVGSGEMDTFGGIRRPSGIAAGPDGTLWVGSSNANYVWQIEADSFEVLQVLELPEASRAEDVAVGGGSVWVSEGPSSAVSRFSARTGKLQHRYSQRGGFSNEVAVGEQAAWATAADGVAAGSGLLRVDLVGGGAQPVAIGQVPYAVTVGLGAVWVTDLVYFPAKTLEPEPGQVLRIDPRITNLADIIQVGKRPTGLAVGDGSVWVANGGEKTISEIDPKTNTVVSTIRTEHYPHSLTYGHGFLWASLYPEAFTF